MVKIIVMLAVLALAGCDSDTVYPYMVKIAAESCEKNGGYHSFVLESSSNKYTIKARCQDGTSAYVDVLFQSLRN